ncbi:hypothetical protein BSKO_02919 [Bryopsis sp. KO-2023]|nr:hypothetical protein BSKO_02919 [Bryopsis sp. KO-2023]
MLQRSLLACVLGGSFENKTSSSSLKVKDWLATDPGIYFGHGRAGHVVTSYRLYSLLFDVVGPPEAVTRDLRRSRHLSKLTTVENEVCSQQELSRFCRRTEVVKKQLEELRESNFLTKCRNLRALNGVCVLRDPRSGRMSLKTLLSLSQLDPSFVLTILGTSPRNACLLVEISKVEHEEERVKPLLLTYKNSLIIRRGKMETKFKPGTSAARAVDDDVSHNTRMGRDGVEGSIGFNGDVVKSTELW